MSVSLLSCDVDQCDYETSLVLLQDVDIYRNVILLFEFWHILWHQWKSDSSEIQCLFVSLVIGQSTGMHRVKYSLFEAVIIKILNIDRSMFFMNIWRHHNVRTTLHRVVLVDIHCQTNDAVQCPS